MVSFIGEYESTLDAKGRFLFPSGFKKQLPDDETVFVINRGLESCLSLYPKKSWNPIYKKISQLNDFDPKVREFRRFYLNGAQLIEMDNAGRLLIPKNLMEYASLEKDIVLVSAIDKIEVWDKVKYKQFIDSFSPEAFSQLANEVMNRSDASLKD
jgi:MraZ protein